MTDHDATSASLETRLRVCGLSACERAPEIYAEILDARDTAADEAVLHRRLDEALERSPTVPGSLAAARLARRLLAAYIDVATDAELDEIEQRVASGEIGPPKLKSTLYTLARRFGVSALTDCSWFDDLFDRVETRRMTERYEAEGA